MKRITKVKDLNGSLTWESCSKGDIRVIIIKIQRDLKDIYMTMRKEIRGSEAHRKRFLPNGLACHVFIKNMMIWKRLFVAGVEWNNF